MTRPNESAAGADRFDVLRITWYCRHHDDDYARIDRVLQALRVELPAALPTTYRTRSGVHEFSWADRFLFRNAACESGEAEWDTRDPVYSGFLVGVRSSLSRSGPPFVSLTIFMQPGDPFDKPAEVRLVQAIGHIALEIDAFYALGLLDEQLFLVKGQLSAGLGSITRHANVMDGQRWLGLPADGVRLEWFGAPYLPLLGQAIDAVGWQIGGGVLLTYGSDVDRLAKIPAELLTRPFPWTAAAVVPRELTNPPIPT